MSHKTNLQRTLVVLALLPFLAFLQGCVAAVAAVAVAVGYVQYDRNEYEEEIDLPFDATWNAARRAVDVLGYPTEREEELGSTESTLEVESLWLRVEKLPFGKSRLRVRVGTFARDDNARRARLVVEQIHRELGLEPPVFEDDLEEPPVAEVPAEGGTK